LSIFINPAKIISEITPLLSLSLRLWGNMLASFILVTVMLFYIDMFEQNHIIQYIINLFCFPITVIFKTFFDLILGFIQSFVFIILSINYWSFAKNSQ
jgi:F-type H+-transporting ATPase subunit a